MHFFHQLYHVFSCAIINDLIKEKKYKQNIDILVLSPFRVCNVYLKFIHRLTKFFFPILVTYSMNFAQYTVMTERRGGQCRGTTGLSNIWQISNTPIPTMEGQIIPTYYYWLPQIFHLPASLVYIY